MHADRQDMPAVDARRMEKTLADIGKLLSEQNFSSAEEANAFLQQLMASGDLMSAAAHEPETPLEQAQEVMYQAWEASGQQRIKLARQALTISPDCADAYVLLAQEASGSLREAADFYAQGVQAGERALGSQVFADDVGHFWGILETRPYMRARAGLAQCLWMLGEREQAIEHYTDMLRLNPGDNQGLRYTLAQWLLMVGADDRLEELLDRYDEPTASWAYTRALSRFRREGPSPAAKAALKAALEANHHVPAYLLGRKRLPNQLPPYVGLGDDNEAVDYVVGAAENWLNAPGALDWLAQHSSLDE
ncbi:MAG: hypothetical protein KIT87_01150 [Anaerolineae bacterium]|nr:hypothetical protein [Anaerolineae bacterium]